MKDDVAQEREDGDESDEIDRGSSAVVELMLSMSSSITHNGMMA